MKSRRQHFNDAVVQRSLETLQQPARFKIRQEGSQTLARSRFLADAREPREGGIPDLNSQVSVCGKNADFGVGSNRQDVVISSLNYYLRLFFCCAVHRLLWRLSSNQPGYR